MSDDYWVSATTTGTPITWNDGVTWNGGVTWSGGAWTAMSNDQRLASMTARYGVDFVTSEDKLRDNNTYCACWLHEKKLMPLNENGFCVKCGGSCTTSRYGVNLRGRAPMGAILAAGLQPSQEYRIGVSADGEESAVCTVRAPLRLEDIDPEDEEDEDVDWDNEDEEDEEDHDDE